MERNSLMERQHVFIIGSKGIPAQYGGFETFVDRLTLYKKSDKIQYHVACLTFKKHDKTKEFLYHEAECFNIEARNIGAAKAIAYDVEALQYCIQYIINKQIEHPIVYILACRIGPFIKHYKKKIKKLGGYLYINPDGHEWKRAKWKLPIKKYWKWSERLMVKHVDLVICDSKNIERYIREVYKKYNPDTRYIAYGSNIRSEEEGTGLKEAQEWYRQHEIRPKEYYLIVGRFVPENNFEIMIKEFMKSKTKRDLVIVTNYEENSYCKRLSKTTQFKSDKRVKFVGTVYEQALLRTIRENAYAYLHGHEVGGTNPSLLEAMGSTNLNLLLDVGFNHEVGGAAAFYWNKKEQQLSSLIDGVDVMEEKEIVLRGNLAKQRMKELYSWEFINSRYERLFLGPLHRNGEGKE